jgi:uncharacterized Ntn-hydrolase superfamily protein
MVSISSSKWVLLILGAAILVTLYPAKSQATFSIVAVDTVTGIVGSAGASCIGGAQIIEGIVENVGAINTQALWNPTNQDHADSLIRAGLTPDSIISWLQNNDAESSPGDRQYGVVTLAGPGASAAYTGFFTFQFAGHRTGPGYSIQGNILLEEHVIDTMELVFLSTGGPMEERLMATLEAAKTPGADSRCLDEGKSSISAFIKVVHPGDGNTPYLYEVVANTPDSIDPIDVLREKFDAWKSAQVADADSSGIEAAPTALPTTGADMAAITVTPLNSNGVPPTKGTSVALTNTGDGALSAVTDNGDGTFSATITAPTSPGRDTVRASVDAGGQIVNVVQEAVLIYFRCGDVNVDGVVTSADVIYLVNHVFKSGAPPQPVPEAGDVNQSGALTSADIIFLVNYIFKSGPAPCS